MLKGGKYQEVLMHSDRGRLSGIMEVLNSVPTIDHNVFKAVRMFIRFFRFPVLILFLPLFRRIHSQPELIMEND